MKKSIWIVLITALLMLLLAACYYLWQSLEEQKQANVELQELAELDKAEMEDQYRLFDIQYGELQKQIRNDSLLALVDTETSVHRNCCANYKTRRRRMLVRLPD